MRGSFDKAVGAIIVGLSAVALMAGAGSAVAAGPTGAYAIFSDCPYENVQVRQCLYVEATGGEFRVGRARIAIVNPLLLQGGTALNFETEVETFFAAKRGDTLSKTPQPGTASANGILNFIATAELARPTSSIEIKAGNLVAGEGTALQLPLRMHLEGEFLGRECYIGSTATPIYLTFTAGRTKPHLPNQPIAGYPGSFAFLEGGGILSDTGYKLVDNDFAVPAASGCGAKPGAIDNLLDLAIGLPASAGENTAILTGNLKRAYAPAVVASTR